MISVICSGAPAARDGRVGECQQHLDSRRSIHPDVQAVVGVIPAQEFVVGGPGTVDGRGLRLPCENGLRC